MTKRSSLYDRSDSFGWISITLHWITTVAIIVLWFIGMSIASQPPEGIDARRSMHITLGLVAWLPLAGRIIWRLRSVHPHVKGQTSLIHNTARINHYLLLLTVTVMIISGPIMAWTLPERTAVAELALAFHSRAAIVLFVLVTLHVLAALKHLMFHDDETIARIFVPKKNHDN